MQFSVNTKLGLPVNMEAPLAFAYIAFIKRSSAKISASSAEIYDNVSFGSSTETSKRLSQKIQGKIGLSTQPDGEFSWIDYDNTFITAITQYDPFHSTNPPLIHWHAQGLKLKGSEIAQLSTQQFNPLLATKEMERLIFSGNDVISGSNEVDSLIGGDGHDVITGLRGADRLRGGAGADRFIYTAIHDAPISASRIEFIADFAGQKGDRIDLSRIDANSKLSGHQSFKFLGLGSFSGKGGEIMFRPISALTGSACLLMETNGDTAYDMKIDLNGSEPFLNKYLIL